MRAVSYTRLGGPEVLEVGELETPEPGPGQVRVAVTLSGVNPSDLKRRSGVGVPPFPRQVPHQDGTGVVDAVGSGVDPARVGERVWLWLAAHENPWGTAAQWCVVPADRAVALPDPASDALGACLGIPALTAHRLLYADGALPADAPILIAGGAGAVGFFAIQLARRAGLRVITTVSGPEKAALAEAAGAHAVVDYRREDAAARIRAFAPEGVVRILEVAPAANTGLDIAVLAPEGIIAVYADDAPVVVRPHMIANTVMRFMLLYSVPADALAWAVRDVSAAVGAAGLQALPLVRFGLDDAAEAHRAVAGGTLGKVVLEID